MNVPCIKSLQGSVLTDPANILATFVEYYKTLYTPIPAYGEQELESILSSLTIPTLSDTDRDGLEADITAEEIVLAFRAFPLHKSPGPDSFCAEWYRLHVVVLVPRLKSLFQCCLENKVLSDSFIEAQVILLPRQGSSGIFILKAHCSPEPGS